MSRIRKEKLLVDYISKNDHLCNDCIYSLFPSMNHIVFLQIHSGVLSSFWASVGLAVRRSLPSMSSIHIGLCAVRSSTGLSSFLNNASVACFPFVRKDAVPCQLAVHLQGVSEFRYYFLGNFSWDNSRSRISIFVSYLPVLIPLKWILKISQLYQWQS